MLSCYYKFNMNINMYIIITLIFIFLFLYIKNIYLLNENEHFTSQIWTPNFLDVNFQPNTQNNLYFFNTGYFYPI